MAKAPKPKQAAKAKGKKGGSPMRSVMIWVVAPIFAVVFHKELILLTIALLPTFAAWFGDMSPTGARSHYAAKTVGPMNLVGALWPLMALHDIGADWTALAEVASDPITWIVVLGSSAVGWAIYLVVPPVVGSYYAMSMDGKRKGLKKTQETLLKEWGAEVGKSAPEELPYEETAPDGDGAPDAGSADETAEPDEDDAAAPAPGQEAAAPAVQDGRSRVRRVSGGGGG